MKSVRAFSGVAAAATMALGTIVGGAGAAHAEAWPEIGYGWVGRYWCAPDHQIKEKKGTGTVKVYVQSSAFNGQGQTMQFKILDANTSQPLGWSGWFEIPTRSYRPIAYNVGNLRRFRLCATFGGGPTDVVNPFEWRGYLDY